MRCLKIYQNGGGTYICECMCKCKYTNFIIRKFLPKNVLSINQKHMKIFDKNT